MKRCNNSYYSRNSFQVFLNQNRNSKRHKEIKERLESIENSLKK